MQAPSLLIAPSRGLPILLCCGVSQQRNLWLHKNECCSAVPASWLITYPTGFALLIINFIKRIVMGKGKPLRRGARLLGASPHKQILFVLAWKYLDKARVSFFQALKQVFHAFSSISILASRIPFPHVALLHLHLMVTPHLLGLNLHTIAPTLSYTFHSSLMQPQPLCHRSWVPCHCYMQFSHSLSAQEHKWILQKEEMRRGGREEKEPEKTPQVLKNIGFPFRALSLPQAHIGSKVSLIKTAIILLILSWWVSWSHPSLTKSGVWCGVLLFQPTTCTAALWNVRFPITRQPHPTKQRWCPAWGEGLLPETCTGHRGCRVPHSQVQRTYPSLCSCHTIQRVKRMGREMMFFTDRNPLQIEVRSQCIANFPQDDQEKYSLD